jgi:hypothetical protein
LNAVLHIEIVDEQVYTYDKPVLQYVQQHYPGTVVFDFDNRSEATTAGYALQIIADAEKVAIILQLREGNTGILFSFFEKLINVQEKCLLFVNGSNRIVERMLSAMEEQQIRKGLSETVQQEEISNYLSAPDL